MSLVDAAFTKRLPKCELHAHLTGSISRQTLHDIYLRKLEETPDLPLEDPLTALASSQSSHNIATFFPLFSKYIYLLINDIDSVQRSTYSVIRDFMDDGVCYLELRTTPRASETMSQDAYVSTVVDTIDRFPNRMVFDTESLQNNRISVYLILSIDRRMTAKEAMNVVDLAIRYQTRSAFGRPDQKGVVGIDLCGDPSKPCDVSKFREALAKAREHGLTISLHFAEVPVSSSDGELQALLSFEPDRLGHVIHVGDEVRGEIMRRKLGLELCLSCNVHAKLTDGGFKGHHFKDWWKEKNRGPIALSTDDVGVFLSPLSNEYLLASQHFDLTYEDLLNLCEEASQAIFVQEERMTIQARIKKLREGSSWLDSSKTFETPEASS